MRVKHAVVVAYNHQPENWWKDYGMEALVYDRSDDGIQRKFDANVIRTPNIGNVDLDKLTFLIEHYHDMPEVFFWGKSNIFKYVTEAALAEAIDAGEFAPLLKMDHKTYSDRYGVVCYYSGGIYHERNDSWYFNEMAHQFPSYIDWAKYLNLPIPGYLPFPPGGNFILTKERVHHYGIDFYEKMANTLSYTQLPAEAHAAERTYFSLWQ